MSGEPTRRHKLMKWVGATETAMQLEREEATIAISSRSINYLEFGYDTCGQSSRCTASVRSAA